MHCKKMQKLFIEYPYTVKNNHILVPVGSSQLAVSRLRGSAQWAQFPLLKVTRGKGRAQWALLEGRP